MEKILDNMKEIIKERSNRQLCEIFEMTNNNNDESIPMIRGLIMDELEKRSQVNFNNWMNEEDPEKMDLPSIYFC